MRTFILKVTPFLLLTILHFDASSQQSSDYSFDRTKMDSLFSIVEENDKAMGSVSIFHDGEEVYHRSIGYADIANDILATSETIYRIGSISKTFTAAIIMQLVDEKKLTLETNLDEFFPEIPNANQITIEHLLRHRSGLYDYLNAEDFNEWSGDPKTQSELIKIFVDNGTIFSAGSKSEYCNTNYALLSFIAEKIEGKAFSEIVDERISEPLQLKSTYFGGKINTSKNEALSYNKLKSWNQSTEIDMSIAMGAGGIVSTPTEVNRFYTALFDQKVVSKRSLKQMTKMVDGNGMGLIEAKPFGRKAFWHNGGIDGFMSVTVYFPDDQVSFTMTLNAVAMNMYVINDCMMSIFFGEGYKLPEFEPILELTSAELDKYLGTYGGSDLPVNITISKNDNMLLAEAPGEGQIALEPYEINKFKSDAEGAQFHFLPEEDQLIFIRGKEYVLTREE